MNTAVCLWSHNYV